LAIYFPTVLLVDVGLPDGSGINLIKPLADASPRIDVIIGTSGDATLKEAVMAAGADDFLEKPVESSLVFQTIVLAHVPADRQPPSPRLVRDEVISPDLVAYQDDLCHVAQVLGRNSDNNTLDYATQFLGGVAHSAQDHDLGHAITPLKQIRREGAPRSRGLCFV
jgi:DNA-binding NtrC family response regulator